MDNAHEFTEKELRKNARRIVTLFNDLKKEIEQDILKTNALIEKLSKQDTEKSRKDILYNKSEQKRLNNLIDTVVSSISSITKKAQNETLGFISDIFEYNYNYMSKLIGIDIKVAKVLTQAVGKYRKLILKTDISSENYKLVKTQLDTGLVKGEGYNKIAERVNFVVDREKYKQIAVARTYGNSAQNDARYQNYKDALDKDIKFKVEWVATNDKRTRPTHRIANGQQVDAGDYFTVGNEKLLYPSDPTGSTEIWNCRCTTKPILR